MTEQIEAGAAGPQTAAKQRRGKWTEQQRRRIVADSLVTGASMQEVAARHGVRPSLLPAWQRRAAKPVK